MNGDIDYNKDYYKILGVAKNASQDDIKKAFRKAAIKFHPDHQQGKSDSEKKSAEEKFKELNEANEVLSDKDKRAEYDQIREMGGIPHGRGGFHFGGMGGGGPDEMMREFMRRHGFGDGMMGGGGGFSNEYFRQTQENRNPVSGQNINININLPFEDFFFGAEKTLDIKVNAKCTHCRNGIDGETPEYGRCPKCGGQGFLTSRRGNMIMQETCQNCGGSGQIIRNRCSYCKGTTIIGQRVQSCTFEIPKFSYSGFSKTYDGVGHCGRYGGSPGNITINAFMNSNGRFSLNSEFDVETLRTVHILPILKALIGGKEKVLTPYGYVDIDIPRCCENLTEITVPSKGMKRINSNDNADLIVILQWDIPKDFSEKETEHIKKVLKSMGDRGDVFENVDKLRKFDDEYAKHIKESLGF